MTFPDIFSVILTSSLSLFITLLLHNYCHPFPQFPFQNTYTLLFPSLLLLPPSKSEDLELGTSDEREHVAFVFLGLSFLTQYIF